MKTIQKNITWGILTNYLQYIISISLGLILSPLILRFAGKETMGAYSILIQVIGYVTLLDIGIGMSASRFIAQAFSKSYIEFTKTCNTYRSITIIQNILMSLVFILLSYYIKDFLKLSKIVNDEIKLSLNILACWSLISSPWIFYNSLLYSTNNLSIQNIIDALCNILKLILSIIFVYSGWAILGLITAQISTQLFSLLIKWAYTRKNIGKIYFNFSIKLTPLLKSIFSFSLNSFLITVAIKLVFSTDNILIGYLFGPIAASSFYITTQPSNLLQQFVLRITDNFYPTLNKWFVNGDYLKLRKSFFLILKVTFLIAIPMCWGIILCTEIVIDYWVGKSNYINQPMALWCGLFAASVVIGHVPNAFVMTFGKIKVLSYFAFFEGTLNILLSIFLGKRLGLHGIMLATLIANIPTTVYLFSKALMLLNCKKEFFSEILNLKYLISAILTPLLWHFNIQVLKYLDYDLSHNLLFFCANIFISFLSSFFFMIKFILARDEKLIILNYFKTKNYDKKI